MSVSDQNSNKPFLRNEFSKISDDLITMTYLTEMNDIYGQTEKLKLILANQLRIKIFEMTIIFINSVIFTFSFRLLKNGENFKQERYCRALPIKYFPRFLIESGL